MKIEDICQILEQAMQLERDGRAFYLKAAERTTAERGREMFLSLADDEAIHLRVLGEQLAAIQSRGVCELLPEIGQADPEWDKGIFPTDPSIFEKSVRQDASDTDALIFALQAEHKSYELYRNAANAVEDPQAKRMFQWLAGVEQAHFNQLMLNYDSLVTTGQWAN